MNTICIVQARLTSSRLPAKVLMPLGNTGKSILEHVYERLSMARSVDKVVFAIPQNSNNERLVVFLQEHRMPYYVYDGDENDVLARYYQCALQEHPLYVFRATCDNPCVDWQEMDILFSHRTEADYLVMGEAPLGVGVELFSFEALERAFLESKDAIEHEHVTPYIYRHPELFKIKRLPYYVNVPNYRLTVDTHEDFLVVNAIYDAIWKGTPIRNTDIYEYLEQHPEISSINAEVEQVKV